MFLGQCRKAPGPAATEIGCGPRQHTAPWRGMADPAALRRENSAGVVRVRGEGMLAGMWGPDPRPAPDHPAVAPMPPTCPARCPSSCAWRPTRCPRPMTPTPYTCVDTERTGGGGGRAGCSSGAGAAQALTPSSTLNTPPPSLIPRLQVAPPRLSYLPTVAEQAFEFFRVRRRENGCRRQVWWGTACFPFAPRPLCPPPTNLDPPAPAPPGGGHALVRLWRRAPAVVRVGGGAVAAGRRAKRERAQAG